MEKRAAFPKGKQKEFLRESKKNLQLIWLEFSQIIDINSKTLKSYEYELCRLPYSVLHKIATIRKLDENELLKTYRGKVVDFDPREVIGRKGIGERRAKLPKINITFKETNLDLNTVEIKTNTFDKKKELQFPKVLSSELAEEIGIHIGDGFLSDKKKEYRLKGDKREKEYYDQFIKPLYKKIYNLAVNIKEYEDTYGFELSSQGFWQFKTKRLGIPAGRKTNIYVPSIIKINHVDILTSFIRGLFDTDGCVSFIKKYKKFGNYYPVISLATQSKKLQEDVIEILVMLGLAPCFSFDGNYYAITLNGYTRLKKYNEIVGWNNAKHQEKIRKWKEEYPELSKDIIISKTQERQQEGLNSA